MANDMAGVVARLTAYLKHTRGLTARATAGNPPTFHYAITDRELDLVDTLLAAYADAARDRDKAQVTADLVRRMGGSTVRADDRVPRDELWWLDERGEVAGKVFGLAARTGEAR